LYVGKHNKDYFLAHGLKENQLVLTPHAIDNDRFAHPNEKYEAEAKEWRKELGVAEDDFVLLFAAKLDANKNPEFVLNIAGKTTFSKIKFIITGNGPLEKEIKQKAGNDKRIIFIDFQNQQKMPVVYRLGDIYMLASNAETWGLGMNEAMACNRPVVATNTVGGAIDLVHGNGLIIKLDDADAVAKYIQHLSENKDLHKTISLKSTEIIKDFSFQHIVDSITGLTKRIEKRA
jgi:glycosyltransferase involved in cell wall biosynthesis